MNVQRPSPPGIVNITMSSDKFATLLRVANSGRLPTKFFVEAGERKGPEARALAHRMRSGLRTKVWDNHAFRILPVFNFVMILPIEVPTVTPATAMAADAVPGPARGCTTPGVPRPSGSRPGR